MGNDIVYMSAPYDVRGKGAADIAWEAVRPFQPLLGQDAQMAAFAAVAHADGVQVRVLAAPEVYSEGVAVDRLRARDAHRVLRHVRFGSPRLPRILKHATNAVVLAEDTTIPTRLGRHPFAAGAALPALVNTVLLYDAMTPVPERIGNGPVSVVMLPRDFASMGMPRAAEESSAATALHGVTLECCTKYQSAAWHRSATPGPGGEAVEALLARAAVVVPWNLAAPGSLIPDVLRKVTLLAAQGRFPLTVVVLPYNDVPGSLDLLKEVATFCGKPHARSQNSPAVLLARAGSIGASRALLRRCRRAWIDTADPEWRWTLRRLAACGLRMNFISDVPEDVSVVYDPGSLAPDEVVTRQMNGRAGLLFWRTRVLSLRRLASLADAVAQDTDVAFRLRSAEPAGRADRPILHDFLSPV